MVFDRRAGRSLQEAALSEITWAVGIFSGDRRGDFAVATAFCSSILALAVAARRTRCGGDRYAAFKEIISNTERLALTR